MKDAHAGSKVMPKQGTGQEVSDIVSPLIASSYLSEPLHGSCAVLGTYEDPKISLPYGCRRQGTAAAAEWNVPGNRLTIHLSRVATFRLPTDV